MVYGINIVGVCVVKLNFSVFKVALCNHVVSSCVGVKLRRYTGRSSRRTIGQYAWCGRFVAVLPSGGNTIGQHLISESELAECRVFLMESFYSHSSNNSQRSVSARVLNSFPGPHIPAVLVEEVSENRWA